MHLVLHVRFLVGRGFGMVYNCLMRKRIGDLTDGTPCGRFDRLKITVYILRAHCNVSGDISLYKAQKFSIV